MSIVRRVLSRLPVTTVFAVSGRGFTIASLIPSQPWAILTFFMLGVPYYLITLLASAIVIDLDLGSYALWVALALVLLSDATVTATRWATDRALRGL